MDKMLCPIMSSLIGTLFSCSVAPFLANDVQSRHSCRLLLPKHSLPRQKHMLLNGTYVKGVTHLPALPCPKHVLLNVLILKGFYPLPALPCQSTCTCTFNSQYPHYLSKSRCTFKWYLIKGLPITRVKIKHYPD